MAWPAAVFRVADIEIRMRTSMEVDGTAVMSESLASIAELIRAAAGSRDRSPIPAAALSKTAARSIALRKDARAIHGAKLETMRPPPWLPTG